MTALRITILTLSVLLTCVLWPWAFPLVYLGLQVYLPVRWEGKWRVAALAPLVVGVSAILGLAWMVKLSLSGVHPDGLEVAIALLPYMALAPILLYYLILLLAFQRAENLENRQHLLTKRAGPGSTPDSSQRQMPSFRGAAKILLFSGTLIALVCILGPVTMRVWNALTAQDIMTLRGHTGFVNCAAYSPNGQFIASADVNVILWDSVTGRQKRTLSGHTALVSSLAFTADGEQIITGSYDRTVRTWNSANGHLGRTLRGHKGSVYSVACSSDGNWIVSSAAGSDSQGQPVNELLIWDARTGKQVGSLYGHAKAVTCVAFSRDSRRIVSGSHDGSIKIWTLDTGKESTTLKGHSGITSVSFSPDGKRIVSGGAAIEQQGVHAMGEVKVWDIGTAQDVLTMTGHTHVVESVAYSPDGKWIVSGSDDKTIRLWDAESGQEVRTFKGHGDMVTSVAFSPDGKRIVSAGRDFTVRIWNVSRP